MSNLDCLCICRTFGGRALIWIGVIISCFTCGLIFDAKAQSADPIVPGPYDVESVSYDFGDEAFQPTDFKNLGGDPKTEIAARVHYPKQLNGGPFPLLVFMHGRHVTCHVPGTQQIRLEWPCSPSPWSSIPSLDGYDYLADLLASHGYIVASIGANGINAVDNELPDLGMQARAEVIQHHLELWRQFNSTDSAPVGSRFVGKVDLMRVGTMGHSRGGEGVVFHHNLNLAQGSPFGLRAVLPLAPVNFSRRLPNNVPMMVMLPYCDGDVSDLQGVHFFDDVRYNIPTDDAAKHYLLVMGANHNFFNSVWSPTSGLPGSVDDWASPWSSVERKNDPFCGTVASNGRLSEAQQKSSALVYMTAFFRAYVGGENFTSLLNGEQAPPDSAGTKDIFANYHAPSSGMKRRDVNRFDKIADLATNQLGGSVSASGFLEMNLCGGAPPLPRQCKIDVNSRWPHTTRSGLAPNSPGLTMLRMKWESAGAVLANQVPAPYSNVLNMNSLQFRIGIDYQGIASNGTGQDLTVRLTDSNSASAAITLSEFSRVLFFPPGKNMEVPKVVLSTVRIPLSAFPGVDMANVKSVELLFDKTDKGEIYVSDLQFSN